MTKHLNKIINILQALGVKPSLVYCNRGSLAVPNCPFFFLLSLYTFFFQLCLKRADAKCLLAPLPRWNLIFVRCFY